MGRGKYSLLLKSVIVTTILVNLIYHVDSNINTQNVATYLGAKYFCLSLCNISYGKKKVGRTVSHLTRRFNIDYCVFGRVGRYSRRETPRCREWYVNKREQKPHYNTQLRYNQQP